MKGTTNMCTRFVYNGKETIVGFNFDIDLSEWEHTVIAEKDRFFIGIKMSDNKYHSFHGINRNGNVGTLLYVHGNDNAQFCGNESCYTIADLTENFIKGKEYAFTILLANAKNPYIILNDGYCGDGGIPGYIFSWLLPNEYTLSHLHVALAHETNHNVRFQFIKWKNDITLGEMIVNEGLAENFATFLYGEDKAGPWVTKTGIETLNEYIKPIIRDGLNVQGLENLNAYLYGDEMAALQNYPQVGLPYCSGYACGYHLIKHYLQKTGKNIVEATLLPAKEILNATEDFWNE